MRTVCPSLRPTASGLGLSVYTCPRALWRQISSITGLDNLSELQMHCFRRIRLVFLRWRFFSAISLHSQCNSVWAAMCFMVGGEWTAWSKQSPFNQRCKRRFLLPWKKHQRGTKLLPGPRNISFPGVVLHRVLGSRGHIRLLWVLFSTKMS